MAITAIASLHSLYAYVRILSPSRGQTVPLESNLKISGDSIDNSTSDCQVSVIVNDIKPYQNATASGPRGPDDFSKWNFVVIPQYTIINEGPNKITSRLSCVNVPAVESPHFYSINITGTRP